MRCLSASAVPDDVAEASRLLAYTCAAAVIFLAALHVRPLVAGFMMMIGK